MQNYCVPTCHIKMSLLLFLLSERQSLTFIPFFLLFVILRVLLRMPTETEQDGLVKGHHVRVFLFMTLFPYSIYDLWGKVQVLSNVMRILTMNQMNPNVQKTGERMNRGCSLHPKYIDSWNVKWTRQKPLHSGLI